jgi:hypothetical protein
MIKEEDIDRALAYLRDNAEKDAQARANRLYMQEWIKVVKAQQQSMSAASSVAASEIEAMCSESYKVALDAYKTSIEMDEKARFLREAASAKIEVFRTEQATRRAEGKAY